tara:strand:+ start:671 stop:964 length:294 start_codon:yes stop_codon:yes gene_type:complete
MDILPLHGEISEFERRKYGYSMNGQGTFCEILIVDCIIMFHMIKIMCILLATFYKRSIASVLLVKPAFFDANLPKKRRMILFNKRIKLIIDHHKILP